jgi:hypothetical protein
MGTIVTIQGTAFALLNGQSVSRSAYPSLSTVWPSGSYTSDATTIVLPNANSLYLRGATLGSANDPDVLLRVALSGVAPSGLAVGSYQTANVKSHAHVSGTQTTSSGPVAYPGGSSPALASDSFTTSTTSGTVIATSLSANRPIEFNKSAVEFDVDNTVVYYYIALT